MPGLLSSRATRARDDEQQRLRGRVDGGPVSPRHQRVSGGPVGVPLLPPPPLPTRLMVVVGPQLSARTEVDIIYRREDSALRYTVDVVVPESARDRD